MKNFLFNYDVAPAIYYDENGDRKESDFWIDIRKQYCNINADDIKSAVKEFARRIDKDWCVTISKNGIKTAKGMFCDDINGQPKQIGYVFKARTDIDFDTCFKQRNVEVWATIKETIMPDFDSLTL